MLQEGPRAHDLVLVRHHESFLAHWRRHCHGINLFHWPRRFDVNEIAVEGLHHFAWNHRVAGGGHPPPAPTERSMQISRTTLVRSCFTAWR